MEGWRARDVFSPPGLVSLTRIALAAAFPFAMRSPAAGMAVLMAAAATDVADGWLARRLGLATSTGALLDPLMDKVFVGTAVAALLVEGRLAFATAFLLVLRDVAEIPLALWLVGHPHALDLPRSHARANVAGKLVTVLQFMTLAAVLLGVRHHELLALTTGILGALAASTYWARAISRAWRERARPGTG